MDSEDITLANIFIKMESEDDLNCETEPEISIKYCQACLVNKPHENNLKDMMQTHIYNGATEIYTEMLHYSFSLQLGENQREGSENVYLICESCVKRLREVVEFRKQVEDAQKNIKKGFFGMKTTSSNLDLSSFDLNAESSDANLSGMEDKESILFLVENELSSMKGSIVKRLPKKVEKIRKTRGKRKNSKEPLIKSTNIAKRDTYLNRSKNLRVVSKSEKTSKKKTALSKEKVSDIQQANIEKEKGRPVLKTTSKYHELPYVLDKFQLECKICNESFATHKSLQIHMPGHFPNFTCEHCGRGFANLGQFKKHRIVHSTERYECPKCPGKLFKSTDSRSTHMRRKHSDNPNINRCPYCNDRFISYDHRRKHLVTVHGKTEEARKYKCKLCDLFFITSGSRSLHVRKSHLNERNCTCQTCGKSFFSNTCLHQHMLKHTGEKNFTCNLCGKSLQRKYNLTKHMKIHTGDKKHVCSICNKAFIEKCSLQRHMAVHDREDVKGES